MVILAERERERTQKKILVERWMDATSAKREKNYKIYHMYICIGKKEEGNRKRTRPPD